MEITVNNYYKIRPQTVCISRCSNFSPQNSQGVYSVGEELESLRIVSDDLNVEDKKKIVQPLQTRKKNTASMVPRPPKIIRILLESEEISPIEIKNTELTKEIENLSVRTKRQLSL